MEKGENKTTLKTKLYISVLSFSEKEKSPEKQPLVFTSQAAQGIKSDPLANLAKLMGGSKRNALLKWCQQKGSSYPVRIRVVKLGCS